MLEEEITLDDLQQQHREIAEAIGLDSLLALADYCGGTQLYIPKREELLKIKKYRAIVAEFDGTNLKELAVKYNTSKSTIYRLVQDKVGKQGKAMAGQMSIFECFPEQK